MLLYLCLLCQASQKGHDHVVRVLLDARADVQGATHEGVSPITMVRACISHTCAMFFACTPACVFLFGVCAFVCMCVCICVCVCVCPVDAVYYTTGTRVISASAAGPDPLVFHAAACSSTADPPVQLPLVHVVQAAQEGHLDVARLLLAAGADVNDDRFYQTTPTEVCCVAVSGYRFVVRLFILSSSSMQATQYRRSCLNLTPRIPLNYRLRHVQSRPAWCASSELLVGLET